MKGLAYCGAIRVSTVQVTSAGPLCSGYSLLCVLDTMSFVLCFVFVCVLETTLCSDSFCLCAGDNCAVIRFVCVLETVSSLL